MKKLILNVPIPKKYLLTIATKGNLGNGELSDSIYLWAVKQCQNHGLLGELKRRKDEVRRAMEAEKKARKDRGMTKRRKVIVLPTKSKSAGSEDVTEVIK
jgi:hypothetical protein